MNKYRISGQRWVAVERLAQERRMLNSGLEDGDDGDPMKSAMILS
jgi:hypothetical protein